MSNFCLMFGEHTSLTSAFFPGRDGVSVWMCWPARPVRGRHSDGGDRWEWLGGGSQPDLQPPGARPLPPTRGQRGVWALRSAARSAGGLRCLRLRVPRSGEWECQWPVASLQCDSAGRSHPHPAHHLLHCTAAGVWGEMWRYPVSEAQAGQDIIKAWCRHGRSQTSR